jgi:hypothetical protein
LQLGEVVEQVALRFHLRLKHRVERVVHRVVVFFVVLTLTGPSAAPSAATEAEAAAAAAAAAACRRGRCRRRPGTVFGSGLELGGRLVRVLRGKLGTVRAKDAAKQAEQRRTKREALVVVDELRRREGCPRRGSNV